MTDHQTIAYAKLHRMETDLHYIRRNPVDGPMLSRFGYDHSNTTVYDSKGRCDLLIPNSVPLASDIARLLQHCSPAIVGELVRGYRLAKASGLLGDGAAIPEIKELVGPTNIEQIAEIIRRHNRKPGGFANDKG